MIIIKNYRVFKPLKQTIFKIFIRTNKQYLEVRDASFDTLTQIYRVGKYWKYNFPNNHCFAIEDFIFLIFCYNLYQVFKVQKGFNKHSFTSAR